MSDSQLKWGSVLAPALGAASVLILAAAPLSAQCLTCTTTTSGGGSCDVDPAPIGYEECSCPCHCEIFCNQVARSFTEVLKDRQAIPDNGVPISDFDSRLLDGVETQQGHGTGTLFYKHALFAGNIGLVQDSFDTWRAFPLESKDSFVMRTCDGRFVARVHRAEELGPAQPGAILASIE